VRKPRKPAERLRTAVEMMPRRTREAMLRGMDDNEIIVGAYTDKHGGVCPMLAAHRNGGRTNFASFARAWDRFTGAQGKARCATRREVRALRSYLEHSLLRDEQEDRSIAELAAAIREERRRIPAPAAKPPPAPDGPATDAPRTRPGDRDRRHELRRRPFWAWLLPTRRYDVFAERVAAADEQLSERRAAEILGDRVVSPEQAADSPE
jgi:hypothetical protein